MKPICLNLGECEGLEDLICATPTIKKLHDSYGQKVTILSKMPEVFKINPFVEKSYKISSIDIGYFYDNYLMHNSFYNIGNKNQSGVEYKHNNIDIRQFHAINLGFTLLKNELDCYYHPLENCRYDIDYKYIAIDTTSKYPSRNWGFENWVELIGEINNLGISVILIGQNSNDKFIGLENALNLIDRTTISDCWHIINNSLLFLTMDSGLLHLAGTTNANILQLGSNINPELRIPYRNGSQSYKHQYIKGSCNIFCGSNMKYSVKEFGNIQGVPQITQCLENKPTFECHPLVEQVFKAITSFI
jgi:hypothetical protein